MAERRTVTQEAAESLAIQALAFLAGEPERLARFVAVTGIDPAQIRTAARTPGFLAGVIEHILADENLLLDFSRDVGIDPGEVMRMHAKLDRQTWERDVP